MKRTVAFLLMLILILSACAPAGGNVPAPENPEPSAPSQTPQNPPEPSEAPSPEMPPEEPTPSESPEPEFDAREFLSGMTLEEKTGQLFLARCPEQGALEDIAAYHPGGYILFGRDFKDKTPESVTDTIAAYQAAASVPMLIAVDEEGGTVARVSAYPQYRAERFPSPRTLYERGGLPLIAETEAEKCLLLSSLGINVNMAPVCDIAADKSAFMYSRSLGLGPEETADFVSAAVGVMAEHGIGSVLKHFPGYGESADTHTGTAVDTRSLDELQKSDLVPFAAGIKASCGAVLVSHTVVTAMDAEHPASLSPAVHEYLRGALGFDGVIVTDDLAMQAITDVYGAGEAAVLAVLAGNDLLCSSEYRVQYAAVLEAAESGRIPEAVIDGAAARVLTWKHELGLMG